MLHKFPNLIDSDYSLISLRRQKRRDESEPFLSLLTLRCRCDAARCNLLVSESLPLFVCVCVLVGAQHKLGNIFTFLLHAATMRRGSMSSLHLSNNSGSKIFSLWEN